MQGRARATYKGRIGGTYVRASAVYKDMVRRTLARASAGTRARFGRDIRQSK